jgi:hypothetical protein
MEARPNAIKKIGTIPMQPKSQPGGVTFTIGKHKRKDTSNARIRAYASSLCDIIDNILNYLSSNIGDLTVRLVYMTT